MGHVKSRPRTSIAESLLATCSRMQDAVSGCQGPLKTYLPPAPPAGSVRPYKIRTRKRGASPAPTGRHAARSSFCIRSPSRPLTRMETGGRQAVGTSMLDRAVRQSLPKPFDGGVGDLGSTQAQGAELRQTFAMLQPGVGELGVRQVQRAERNAAISGDRINLWEL